MATVAAIRLVNIITVTQGANIYKGVRSVSIATNKGNLLPILEEGDLYPENAELVGTPEFPVTTSLVFEQDFGNMLALLNEAKATLVIVLKKALSAGNQTVTISNHQFNRMSNSQNLQDAGRPSIEGSAHSAAGTTLPIVVT